VSWDEGANWEEAVRAAPHPDEGRPFDLAFRVRTVDPQWTLWPEPLRITQVERDAGGSYRLGSTGLGGPGSQALQYSTNLSAGRWVDAEVNPYPLPWPQLNTWLHGDRGLTNVFFRVIQR
jgi:hypothetical protein